jgi:hypothetical protein
MFSRSIPYLLFWLILPSTIIAQNEPSNKKGDFYFSWGYSREWFSKSDIQFTGDNYDLKLDNVKAKDRQSPFAWNPYFQIDKLTIPQYNFRLGYFISDKYSITLGWDHMKYVMVKDQTVGINGYITDVDTLYNGTYTNDQIKLTPEFLTLEHTDGLNYANVELRRFDNILHRPKLAVNIVTGAGIGILYPKSNVSLMNKGRADEWHLSGYGASTVAGLNATFFKHYFIQSELKGGFINMPDIRTTHSEADRAKQHFFFTQWNVVFGAKFNILKSKK